MVRAGKEPDRAIGVLVATGNAGNRSLRAPLAAALARKGHAADDLVPAAATRPGLTPR